VDDGARTHDNRNHNPGLYQLSYIHHWEYGVRQVLKNDGVDDGARTHDNRNHNPGLYQLSYIHHSMRLLDNTGAPDRTRTCNPRLRRPVLYPVELRVQSVRLGSVVGAVGFELTTTWSQTRCATRLRYAPTAESANIRIDGDAVNTH